jgi:rhodanese-related sulfurtransferase
MPIETQPSEVKTQLDNGDSIVLLDVRQPEEVQAASIKGAVCIPMGEVMNRIDELKQDAETIVFCHHGMRSMQVATLLEQRGFKNVKNLAGGINAWASTVDTSVPHYEFDGRSVRVHPQG